MLLAPFAPKDHASPQTRARLKSGRVVWQQRYEGIATVAYQGGKAVAGISGPWSDRYVLTWWDQPASPNQIELFETLDAAMLAVAQRMGDEMPRLPDAARKTGASWLRRLTSFLRRMRLAKPAPALRMVEETDLRGLHFGATR
jgi:hypothetical protein